MGQHGRELENMKRKAKSASSILGSVYGESKNFMTPKIMKKGKLGKSSAYELSSGEGFRGNNLFGVSIGYEDNGKYYKSSLSRSFSKKSSAERYIKRLKLFGRGL